MKTWTTWSILSQDGYAHDYYTYEFDGCVTLEYHMLVAPAVQLYNERYCPDARVYTIFSNMRVLR